MDDKTIIELCAKAMGMQGEYVTGYGVKGYHYSGLNDGILYEVPGTSDVMQIWNPLEDPADYEQMEAELGLDVTWLSQAVSVSVIRLRAKGEFISRLENYADHSGDKRAAKRRAGCLVVSEIARRMK